MTDKTHLDELAAETGGDLAKLLIAEFVGLVRDPGVPTVSYSARLRALLEERLQAKDDTSG